MTGQKRREMPSDLLLSAGSKHTRLYCALIGRGGGDSLSSTETQEIGCKQAKKSQRPMSRADDALSKDEVKSLWIKSVWEVDFLLNWREIQLSNCCFIQSIYG